VLLIVLAKPEYCNYFHFPISRCELVFGRDQLENEYNHLSFILEFLCREPLQPTGWVAICGFHFYFLG
jgi:hypothetical protein